MIKKKAEMEGLREREGDGCERLIDKDRKNLRMEYSKVRGDFLRHGEDTERYSPR